MMSQKAGSIWAGYLMPWDKLVYAIEVGQRYLMENTTLGIPAMFQTEGSLCCFMEKELNVDIVILQVCMDSPTTGLYGHRPSDFQLLSTRTCLRRQLRL
jgi:hypothetical protein